MQIRKIGLVLIIIASLLAGCIGGYFACYYTAPMNGSVMVPEDEYAALSAFAKKYGKAELLYNYISENYYTEVDEQALADGMYYGMFESLDDMYSMYLNEDELEDLMISTSGDYSGVGITMSITADEKNVYALSVTEDSPAWKAGVKAGDIILKIDGVEYSGDQLDECAHHARGEAGTEVVITVLRNEKIIDFNITRARILAKTVKSEMLEDNIGYISISSFENPTYDDFKAALEKLEEGGAAGLVIDIRDNGGGLVDICQQVADLIMDEGTLVYTEDHNGNREYMKTEAGRTSLPYVLLVNGNSASASEILSAGVQDNAEGKIVGTVTFGKGIIQDVRGLYDGTGVKLTIQQYFSPNGNVIHKKGVIPDYIVELTDDCYDENYNLTDDRQLKKALEVIKAQIR